MMKKNGYRRLPYKKYFKCDAYKANKIKKDFELKELFN